MNRTRVATWTSALLVAAALPAFSQPNSETELYTSAKAKWELEIRPEVRAELEPRWAALNEKLALLKEARAGLPAGDPRIAALEALHAADQKARMQGSGTLRGNHGNVAGTDGAAIGAANFLKADALISEWASTGAEMTVERLMELNRVLGTGLQHNGRPPGTIRRVAGENITAGGVYHYVPGVHVSEAMTNFAEWYESSKSAGMPPAELAGKAYMRLCSIHPFWDGNGRTTRMLMDWVLRSNGFPPVVLQDVLVAVFGARDIQNVPAEKAVNEVTKGLEKALAARLEIVNPNSGFATRRRRAGPTEPNRFPAGEVEALFAKVREASRVRALAEGRSPAPLSSLKLEIVSTNDVMAKIEGERIRLSVGLLNEIHHRTAGLPDAKRARSRILGLILGHEVSHALGIRAEQVADTMALRILERAGLAPNAAELKAALDVFQRPTGATHLDRFLGRLRDLYRYGTPRGRLSNLERAARGEVDRLAQYRRGDGTLDWKRLGKAGALREGGALGHFALALFLKELAVVAHTGDRLRIEEFFDGLLTTDFFQHYGLFALGARGGELLYARYLERHVRGGFVNSVLKNQVVLAAGLALPELAAGRFSGKTFAISLGSLGLSSAAVKAGVSSLKWVYDLRRPANAGRLAALGRRSQLLARASKLGAWTYTAGELAVVLYVADEISEAYYSWESRRAAKGALAEGVQGLLAVANDPSKGLPELRAALAAEEQGWGDYRNYLYGPLHQAEALFTQRLQKLAVEAKLIADQRSGLIDQLPGRRGLSERATARYGSPEAYADALIQPKRDALSRDARLALQVYERDRIKALQEIYGERLRGRELLAEVGSLDWNLRGGAKGQAGDPFAERGDAFAAWGRKRARDSFQDAIGDVSDNRLQAYQDQAELYAAVARSLRRGGQHARAEVFEDAHDRALELQRADEALILGQALPAPN